MPRLVAALLAGLLAGITAAYLVLRTAETPATGAVVRDLAVTQRVTAEAAAWLDRIGDAQVPRAVYWNGRQRACTGPQAARKRRVA